MENTPTQYPNNVPPPPPGETKTTAFFSIGIGAIIVLMFPRLLSWFGHKLFGRPFTWTFNNELGVPITYTQSIFFPGDLAIFIFGVSMIFDGITYLTGRGKRMLMTSMALCAISIAFNAYYVIWMYSSGGLQIMSALAVVFGGLIFSMQMNDYKRRYVKSVGQTG